MDPPKTVQNKLNMKIATNGGGRERRDDEVM